MAAGAGVLRGVLGVRLRRGAVVGAPMTLSALTFAFLLAAHFAKWASR